MQSIKQDIELLRKKAAECEAIAKHAAHVDIRRLNQQRARLYNEMVDEAEASLWRDHVAAFRKGVR